MNEEELKANKEASEYVVHDLNLEPDLPFPDNSFDIITNAVSVDYLNKPLEVCSVYCMLSYVVLCHVVSFYVTFGYMAPFPDNSFNIITNTVSVNYLNKPLEVRYIMLCWVS